MYREQACHAKSVIELEHNQNSADFCQQSTRLQTSRVPKKQLDLPWGKHDPL